MRPFILPGRCFLTPNRPYAMPERFDVMSGPPLVMEFQRFIARNGSLIVYRIRHLTRGPSDITNGCSCRMKERDFIAQGRLGMMNENPRIT